MEKELTQKEMDDLVKVIDSDVMRKDFAEKKGAIAEQKGQLMDSISGLSSDKEFIQDKLDRFETVEELQSYIKTNEHLMEMYTDPETEEVLEITIKDFGDSNEMQFRRDLLVYLKESDVQTRNIDKAFEDMDRATAEFQTDVNQACYELGDNVLVYMRSLRDRAEATDSPRDKRLLNKSADAIESGFNLKAFKDTYTKYPSAVERCKKFITNEAEIVEIGKRYMNKLRTESRKKTNLIQYVSDLDNRPSFEELVFHPDQYNTVKDIFVFSLIRYFSMADFSDLAVVQLHATISLNIRKLIANDMDEVIKEDFKNNILEYLKIFE